MADVAESVQWMCGVCRYVYDSESGDPRSNIVKGTAFEDLPDNWVCPVCKAGKEKFFDI